MQKYQNNVQTLDGRAIVGASVIVTQYPSGAPATVYNQNGSGVITQPILTNGDGEFAFYAANGRYQLQVTGGGISVAQTITDIVLFDPADGSADEFGFTQVGTGAVSRTVQSKLEESVSARDFGAGGLGLTDDTAAIQAALDTGKSVDLGYGIFTITGTLHFAVDGQILFGRGKDNQTTVRNIANANPLFTYSTGTGAVYRRRCGIHGIHFQGNSNTTEGVALRGIVDDGLTTDADKSCWMREVRITDVGAGFGLRVSSWANTFNTIEIWSCNKGLKCGAEFNANSFNGLYISGCTNEAISAPTSAGIPASNVFVNTVAQYSAGTNATIDLQEAYAFSFHGLYMEGNTSPCNLLLGAGSQGCVVTGMMHNLATGTSGIQVVRNEGKENTILGVTNLGGTVDSLVRIEGTLPLTVVGSLFVSVGTATNGALYDLSTRKATVSLDGVGSRMGPTVFRALTTENTLETRRSDTDAVLSFWRNGALYFGPDTTVPVLSRTGGTLSMTYSAGTGTFRAPQFAFGTTGDPLILFGPGTPEGARTAPVGSTYHRTDGGAGTSFYVKESGTGNTGWVGK